jgi:hypothetical protein
MLKGDIRISAAEVVNLTRGSDILLHFIGSNAGVDNNLFECIHVVVCVLLFSMMLIYNRQNALLCNLQHKTQSNHCTVQTLVTCHMLFIMMGMDR